MPEISAQHTIFIDRALRELRAGLPLVISGPKPFWLQAAEFGIPTHTPENTQPQLIITAERAASLGLTATPHAIATIPDEDILLRWINPLATAPTDLKAATPMPLAASELLQLTKWAELLPALWLTPLDPNLPLERWASARGWITLPRESIASYEPSLLASYHLSSDATVPLEGLDPIRVQSYRPRHGGLEQLALLIGTIPTDGTPVPVRLHSSCVTGDILGSLRCDCGPQLRKAILDSAAHGFGIVLYLNQEGRGIGIANKLKAYCLQDQGRDTIDANELLGYKPDERNFAIAAAILKQLGLQRIELMTNNPEKIRQMEQLGIEVTTRRAHEIAPNGINNDYLSTKATRSGHLFKPSDR